MIMETKQTLYSWISSIAYGFTYENLVCEKTLRAYRILGIYMYVFVENASKFSLKWFTNGWI